MMEAERLAKANPGNEFYVFEATAMAVKADVLWSKASREIPF